MFSNSPRRQPHSSPQRGGTATIGGIGPNIADSPESTQPHSSGAPVPTAAGVGSSSSTNVINNSAVSASLHTSSEYQYSSVALSPSRRYAILAGNDVLQVVRLTDVATAGQKNDDDNGFVPPSGGRGGGINTSNQNSRRDHSLCMVRSMKITQYLSSNAAGTTTAGSGGVSGGSDNTGGGVGGNRRYGDVRDAFNLMAVMGGIGGDANNAGVAAAAAAAGGGGSSAGGRSVGAIKVARVAWSNYFLPPHHAHQSSHTGTVRSSNTRIVDANIEENEVISSSRQQHPSPESDQHSQMDEEDQQSFIAAAGSNGVVAIWNARTFLFSSSPSSGQSSSSTPSSSFHNAAGRRRHVELSSASSSNSAAASSTAAAGSMMTQPPEGILSQHTRSVNALAWHPTRLGLLLTGSQDSTIKLWERRVTGNASTGEPKEQQDNSEDEDSQSRRRPWFMKGGGRGGGSDTASSPGETPQEGSASRTYAKWWCRTTFEPKSDAILDVQWSKFQDDTFGVVTGSGNLIVYSMYLTAKALVKIAAHTGDATSLDWHPTKRFCVATGGSNDRCVKVWDLEPFLNMEQHQGDYTSITLNSNTWGTQQSSTSVSSSETEKSLPSMHSGLTGAQQAAAYAARTTSSGLSLGGGGGGGGRMKTSSISKHVLSIAASVTHVRWRPPSNALLPLFDDADNEKGLMDRHDHHLAVATARNSSAGGSGVISLWSINRPFMPLSVMEGHKEGAVSDFLWLQTPLLIPESKSTLSLNSLLTSDESTLMRSYAIASTKESYEMQETNQTVSYVWQHCLSVGRDGKCLIQSFVRGDRPIRRVPSSCFAMTNLSPFQKGYGSLQCFSVYQNVPNQIQDDFALTGLRQDEYTARATGAFNEPTLTKQETEDQSQFEDKGERIPAKPPRMIFSVVDQGNLDQNGLPVASDEEATLCVAPEVIHLSRFARLYKMYPDESCPTPVDICEYNGDIAARLGQVYLSHMWKTIKSLLQGCGLQSGGLPLARSALSLPENAMQFVILPTIKSVLYERADAGDVQTCVVLCEVLQVIEQGGKTTKVPGLTMDIVREWYMSYIDLLHQMCLFTAATFLIKHCRDPSIGALNQQSTTIHESCPVCGKPLDPAVESSALKGTNLSDISVARRTCKNCRRRVGKCFVCHEPVQGMYVWCPGCGHGGCVSHAIHWFSGGDGSSTDVRQFCPTGCGHKCNLTKMTTRTSAFPRTGSFKNLPMLSG